MTVTSDIKEQLKHIKHFALDMDGTIYNGSTLFPFTNDFLNHLKAQGIGYSFLTNNPSKNTADYLKHLEEMGISATKEEMYTSAVATINYIKNQHPSIKKLFILGTPSMIKEFEDAGFISTADNAEDKPDALVVGFDTSLIYSRLCRAAYWATQQLPYFATNPDWVCPTDQPNILVDCGSICACIEGATKRKPDIVIGKPDPGMLDGIIKKYKLKPNEIAVVGDRIYTDVQTAKNIGALGVLVLSGEASISDVLASTVKPDIVTKDLSELLELIQQSNA